MNDNDEEKTPERSALEEQFEATYDAAITSIRVEVAKAREALSAAVKIAEEHGVPFRSGISPLGQGYIPKSFEKKFPGIDENFVSEVADVYDRYGDGLYAGWQHSAVC
jgi:hypothetical protein